MKLILLSKVFKFHLIIRYLCFLQNNIALEQIASKDFHFSGMYVDETFPSRKQGQKKSVVESFHPPVGITIPVSAPKVSPNSFVCNFERAQFLSYYSTLMMKGQFLGACVALTNFVTVS